MLWLYGQDWFLNVSLFGIDMRELFQIRNYNLSVAVWVGFLALFGIATDDGVIISTYLNQVFARRKPATVAEIREATVEAGKRRIRPAMMTAVTTLLALIPILTSTGRGADIMVPMAIPSFGGMAVVLVQVLTVPVLYSWLAEFRLRSQSRVVDR
jgi:Cu(I)/Ag(I) efflux system membrane protein CusA/SilA